MATTSTTSTGTTGTTGTFPSRLHRPVHPIIIIIKVKPSFFSTKRRQIDGLTRLHFILQGNRVAVVPLVTYYLPGKGLPQQRNPLNCPGHYNLVSSLHLPRLQLRIASERQIRFGFCHSFIHSSS